MTYAGGTYPSVSGQPPQRRTQYALPASISRKRASCSPARVMMTTFGGNASLITALSNFPLEHDFQYGFGTRKPSGYAPDSSDGLKTGAGNAYPSHAPVYPHYFSLRITATWGRFHEQRRRSSPVCAVGPAVEVAPQLPSRPAGPPHHAERAALHRSPLCPFPKALSQSLKLSRRSVRLPHSLPFQPHGGGLVFHARYLPRLAKVAKDNVAHSLASKSAEPVRPVAVIHQ